MSYWAHRRYDERYDGWGRIQRSNFRGLLVVVILICAAAYVVHKGSTSPGGYRNWTRHWTGPRIPITGRAWVIDGDTIELAGRRVRLEGIDAPESAQTCSDAKGHPWPCGTAATRELAGRLRGHEVKCDPVGYDRYRRVLAVCSLAGGDEINAWMVRQGWAAAYGYAGTYQSAQDEAKAARRGIWSGSFEQPSAWRKRQRD
jgi:endonuclease YncB( thermonuclease family)